MPERREIAVDLDVHRVIENSRETFSESENDILRRLLLPQPKKETNSLIRNETRPAPATRGTVTRSRGLWSIQIKDERIAAESMIDAYRLLLIRLGKLVPGFFDRLALEGNKRRRLIARSAGELYISSPHLTRDHAQHLTDDWFFDTNLSTEQVAQRARIAARVAGLTYGRDVRLLDNMREV
jgi:hypothetical protein